MEGETGHVLAHALIQRQNGTERNVLEQIPPQKDAICTNVKVDVFLRFFLRMISAYFGALVQNPKKSF